MSQIRIRKVCKACSDGGYPIIVRSARNNAKAKQARLEKQYAREAASTGAANTTVAITTTEFSTIAPTTNAATTASTSQAEPHQLPKPAKRKKRTGTANTRYVKIHCLSCTLMMFPRCRK